MYHGHAQANRVPTISADKRQGASQRANTASDEQFSAAKMLLLDIYICVYWLVGCRRLVAMLWRLAKLSAECATQRQTTWYCRHAVVADARARSANATGRRWTCMAYRKRRQGLLPPACLSSTLRLCTVGSFVATPATILSCPPCPYGRRLWTTSTQTSA